MSDTLKATAAVYDHDIANLNQQIANLENRRVDIQAARDAIEPALSELRAAEAATNTDNSSPAHS